MASLSAERHLRPLLFFFLESTFKDQINPKQQTAGPPEGGSPELDLEAAAVIRTQPFDTIATSRGDAGYGVASSFTLVLHSEVRWALILAL